MSETSLEEYTMPRIRQNRLCLEWIRYCESIGWMKKDIPTLVDIFWQYRGWQTFKGWKP